MKSIKYGETNPYLGPRFNELNNDTYFPRTTQTKMQSFYEKKYNFSERLLKLISLVKTSVAYTFYYLTSSNKNILLKTKLDRLYSIVNKGTSIKTLNINLPLLKLEVEKKVLSLGSVTLPLVTTSELQDKTKELAAKNISFIINNSTQLPNPNRIKRKKIEKFLTAVETSPLVSYGRNKSHQLNSSKVEQLDSWKLLFETIDCISFAELKKGLSICCQELNNLLT